jgi:hypothetical protein
MTVEYEMGAVSSFVVAAVLIWNRFRIWKRMRTIETRLKKMEEEIDILQMAETRRLLIELNTKSREKIGPPDTALEKGGGDVGGQAPHGKMTTFRTYDGGHHVHADAEADSCPGSGSPGNWLPKWPLRGGGVRSIYERHSHK